MKSNRPRLFRLMASLPLAVLATACADTVSVVVAPRLGQTTECVEWQGMGDIAADWLASNPVPAPPEWFAWEDYLASKVQPKLAKDCE